MSFLYRGYICTWDILHWGYFCTWDIFALGIFLSRGYFCTGDIFVPGIFLYRGYFCHGDIFVSGIFLPGIFLLGIFLYGDILAGDIFVGDNFAGIFLWGYFVAEPKNLPCLVIYAGCSSGRTLNLVLSGLFSYTILLRRFFPEVCFLDFPRWIFPPIFFRSSHYFCILCLF